jgi:DNA modification methylase
MTREPYLQDADCTLYHGDALDVLRELPDESVHCIATSPPFYALRDYGVDGQIGLEETPDAWAAALVAVFREARRVLRKDGTLWVECGDSYSGLARIPYGDQGKREHGTDADRIRKPLTPGLKQKDLTGAPWLLAFALRADGWWLRGCNIWAKPNAMPESAKDRCTTAHSYVFQLSRSARYFFDGDAISEPAAWERWGDQTVPKHEGTETAAGWIQPKTKNELAAEFDHRRAGLVGQKWKDTGRVTNGRRERTEDVRGFDNRLERADGLKHPRSVWTIPTQGYPEAHFACVDDQTEALTPTGWRKHHELSDGDRVAVYDPRTDECVFEPAEFHRYDYDGDLVVIEKRDSSQRLTPNHRCLVRERVRDRNDKRKVVLAEDLKPGHEILTTAPLRTEAIDGIGPKLAALLGWYVTEGSDSDWGVTLYQSESANPEKVVEIRSLLEDVSAEFTEGSRVRGENSYASGSTQVEFRVRGQIGRFLQGCGKSLTLDAMRLPGSEPQAVLDALVAGDGHLRSDGRSCIVQKDKASIDKMQMLALRCGYRAIVSERKDGQHVLYLTRGRWLTLRSTNGAHEPLGREHYQGIVWCPSVRTGFWLARRRGRPFVTGNTWPEALARRIISAGCPEQVCRECGNARERIVDRGENVHPGSSHDHSRDAESGNVQQRADGKAAGSIMRERYYARQASATGEITYTDCGHNAYEPGVVLDPFVGSGTTCLVARKCGRRSIGIDLNPEYLDLAARRLQQQSLFAEAP